MFISNAALGISASLVMSVAADSSIAQILVELPSGQIVEVQEVEMLHDFGAANRIVAGDVLRTISQEIPAAACHLHNGVATEDAMKLLVTSVTKFDVLLDALLNGNDELGIEGAETRPRTIVEIEQLMEDWAPVHEAALAVADDHSDAAAISTIYASTDPMLDKTYHLLSTIEGQYSNPSEVLQSDVMLLEVAGRLAATNQRIAYEGCRLWSDGGDEKIAADFDKSIGIFEASMDALQNGLPALGIMPAPTEEISGKLTEIRDGWGDLRVMLDQVAAGDDIAEGTRADIYTKLADKLYSIEELEVLYQDFSKRIF